MRLDVSLLLASVSLALAGCGGASAPEGAFNEAQAQAAGVAPDPEKAMSDRWTGMFTDPAAIVAAANEFGYKIDGYKPTGNAAFRAAGVEQTLPDATAPVVIKTGFTASGAAAERVDTIVFTFDIDVKREPRSKTEAEIGRTPDRIVRGFLSRFGVGPGDEIRAALNNRQSASATLHRVATLSVEAQPLPGAGPKSRRVTVRIVRQALATPQQNPTARK